MWTKLCGFRSPDTAALAVSLGADAIGLNFFPASVRFVQPIAAREIVEAIGPNVLSVGLFVNARLEDLVNASTVSGVNAIQLHGSEDPQYLSDLRAALPGLPVIKAFAVGQNGTASVTDWLRACVGVTEPPEFILLDAHVPGEHGGTGRTAPWGLIAEERKPTWPKVILAGGLNPANVQQAIHQVQPYGVDLASGVEVERGTKDPALIEQLLSITKGETPAG